jgi:ABC-type multidrug transport system permease subunit
VGAAGTVRAPYGLGRRSRRSELAVLAAVAVARLRIMSRYPGVLAFNVVLPLVIASMPILLGRSIAGDRTAENFALNTGTPEYVAYMLLGANVYMVITNSLWFVGNWMRREQQTGTLEALYLAPTGRVWLLAGVALAGAGRSVLTALLAFVIGCLIYGVNPLQGNVLLALAFLAMGLPPMFGLSLAYGAAVLRFKEAQALINAAQWVIGFLMGLYFPVAVFPPLLRAIALAFPPTWTNNGVRAAILGVGYFFESWYADLAMLGVFAVLAPLVGYRIFAAVERALKRDEGIGEF